MIKKMKIPLILAILSALVFYFSNTKLFIGKLINHFFPCDQDPTTSFPCFAKWDILVMILMAGIFTVSVVWGVVVIIKKK